MLNGLGGEEEVESALGQCLEAGAPRADHHGANLSDPSQIGGLFERVEEEWGRAPDILVNNAGI